VVVFTFFVPWTKTFCATGFVLMRLHSLGGEPVAEYSVILPQRPFPMRTLIRDRSQVEPE